MWQRLDPFAPKPTNQGSGLRAQGSWGRLAPLLSTPKQLRTGRTLRNGRDETEVTRPIANEGEDTRYGSMREDAFEGCVVERGDTLGADGVTGGRGFYLSYTPMWHVQGLRFHLIWLAFLQNLPISATKRVHPMSFFSGTPLRPKPAPSAEAESRQLRQKPVPGLKRSCHAESTTATLGARSARACVFKGVLMGDPFSCDGRGWKEEGHSQSQSS